MKDYGHASVSLLVSLAIAITLACGSPAAQSCKSAPTASNDSMPKSIMLCPAVADPQDYPDGQVQFLAIGSFATSPSPALLETQVWGACQDDQPTAAGSVSSVGLARCESGASGAYGVFASDMTNCLAIGPCGTGCFVSGYAKLTCP
jgi:hypothetical protein